MSIVTDSRDRDEVDDFIHAFERAYDDRGAANLAEFLPPPGHSLYAVVLRELVRVDLEYRWERGRPRSLADYQAEFSSLSDDPEGLSAIAFEESRLRREAEKEAPRSRPGGDGGLLLPVGLERIALCYREARASGAEELDSWCAEHASEGAHARLFHDVFQGDSRVADRLALGLTSMPEVGDDFLGFRLIDEMGRGTFGRVYLARQGDLADRPVVLKVTAESCDESQTLARLQHTNIVPIYSRHRADPLQVVCMPFLGATTLRDVFNDLKVQDGLPDSGLGLLSAINSRRSDPWTARKPEPLPVETTEEPARDGTGSSPSRPAGSSLAPGASAEALRVLGRLTYVEAVLWMASRLADGLAHAHERGVIHRDLKPANILLADDGQPLLLDFNLADDAGLRRHASAAAVGGTLPYMAPEHLEAFQGSRRPVDARSDVYSLGVILYELLTGRPPFERRPRGEAWPTIDAMRAERLGPPPGLRAWNPAVSPAVESIVRHCLEPVPERRYPSARALAEDLERHLAHRPLQYAPEPSLNERARKFARRHPRLTAKTTLTVCSCALVLGVVGALTANADRLARLEAGHRLARFQESMRESQQHLNTWVEDRAKRPEGVARAREALALYGAWNNPDWRRHSDLSYLSPADRDRLREGTGELLMLLARAERLEADADPNRPDDPDRLQAALRLNDQAVACEAPRPPTRALLQQRARLLDRLGRKNEAQRVQEKAAETPLQTSRDYYLVGVELATHHHYRDALEPLMKALRLDPKNYWAWFVAGWCYETLAEDDHAADSYGTCTALWPDHAAAWYNRALVRARQYRYAQAEADLNRVIELCPTDPAPYIDRALAYMRRSKSPDYKGANNDLTHALELGSPATCIYLFRARARKALGDVEGERSDRGEGLRRVPTDEQSWLARSSARLYNNPSDPEGALADVEEALKLHPRSMIALKYKAHILAENLGRTANAVRVFDKFLDFYPNHTAMRSSRGVYLARLGRREAALRDAEESLEDVPTPAITYQVAGIYALTSRQSPADRIEALRLLESALKHGFGLKVIDGDHDLDPIRNLPEFASLLGKFRKLATEHTKGTEKKRDKS